MKTGKVSQIIEKEQPMKIEEKKGSSDNSLKKDKLQLQKKKRMSVLNLKEMNCQTTKLLNYFDSSSEEQDEKGGFTAVRNIKDLERKVLSFQDLTKLNELENVKEKEINENSLLPGKFDNNYGENQPEENLELTEKD